MKGGNVRPENCPPCPVCPVCEQKINEPPENTGFFGRLFGVGKKANEKLQDAQTGIFGFAASKGEQAKTTAKDLMRKSLGPLNNLVKPNEPPPQAAQLDQQPNQQQLEEEEEEKQVGGRKRKHKNKKHTKKQNKKHGSKKHHKKRTTTKKRFVRRM
jgi:hypothetical protein